MVFKENSYPSSLINKKFLVFLKDNFSLLPKVESIQYFFKEQIKLFFLISHPLSYVTLPQKFSISSLSKLKKFVFSGNVCLCE